MGITNREYYQSPGDGGGWSSSALTPAVKSLLVANVVVFLLQLFVLRDDRTSPLEQVRRYNPEVDRLVSEAEADPEKRKALEKRHPELVRLMDDDTADDPLLPARKVSVVQEWLQLDAEKVVRHGQVWRLLTCAFCHDRLGVWHIVFNMFFLIWFGCTLERMYGSREFLLFYLAAALVASVAYIALDAYTGSSAPAVGASGAVFGVVMLYAMHFPHETVCVYFVCIELRWLIVIYVIWDVHPVLLALAGDRLSTGVAHAAHLGGLLFGYLYACSSWRLESVLSRLPRPSVRAGRPAVEAGRADPTEADRVDELLAKISRSGPDSLSDDERDYLKRAGRRMKRRVSDPGGQWY